MSPRSEIYAEEMEAGSSPKKRDNKLSLPINRLSQHPALQRWHQLEDDDTDEQTYENVDEHGFRQRYSYSPNAMQQPSNENTDSQRPPQSLPAISKPVHSRSEDIRRNLYASRKSRRRATELNHFDECHPRLQTAPVKFTNVASKSTAIPSMEYGTATFSNTRGPVLDSVYASMNRVPLTEPIYMEFDHRANIEEKKDDPQHSPDALQSQSVNISDEILDYAPTQLESSSSKMHTRNRSRTQERLSRRSRRFSPHPARSSGGGHHSRSPSPEHSRRCLGSWSTADKQRMAGFVDLGEDPTSMENPRPQDDRLNSDTLGTAGQTSTARKPKKSSVIVTPPPGRSLSETIGVSGAVNPIFFRELLADHDSIVTGASKQELLPKYVASPGGGKHVQVTPFVSSSGSVLSPKEDEAPNVRNRRRSLLLRGSFVRRLPTGNKSSGKKECLPVPSTLLLRAGRHDKKNVVRQLLDEKSDCDANLPKINEFLIDVNEKDKRRWDALAGQSAAPLKSKQPLQALAANAVADSIHHFPGTVEKLVEKPPISPVTKSVTGTGPSSGSGGRLRQPVDLDDDDFSESQVSYDLFQRPTGLHRGGSSEEAFPLMSDFASQTAGRLDVRAVRFASILTETRDEKTKLDPFDASSSTEVPWDEKGESPMTSFLPGSDMSRRDSTDKPPRLATPVSILRTRTRFSTARSNPISRLEQKIGSDASSFDRERSGGGSQWGISPSPDAFGNTSRTVWQTRPNDPRTGLLDCAVDSRYLPTFDKRRVSPPFGHPAEKGQPYAVDRQTVLISDGTRQPGFYPDPPLHIDVSPCSSNTFSFIPRLTNRMLLGNGGRVNARLTSGCFH
jgi:hypothetical protein